MNLTFTKIPPFFFKPPSLFCFCFLTFSRSRDTEKYFSTRKTKGPENRVQGKIKGQEITYTVSFSCCQAWFFKMFQIS